MDYMNLHQSAHGDREFGFIATRMGVARKIVVGHWSEPVTRARIAAWSRAACGWHEAQNLSTVRFGDNMRTSRLPRATRSARRCSSVWP